MPPRKTYLEHHSAPTPRRAGDRPDGHTAATRRQGARQHLRIAGRRARPCWNLSRWATCRRYRYIEPDTDARRHGGRWHERRRLRQGQRRSAAGTDKAIADVVAGVESATPSACRLDLLRADCEEKRGGLHARFKAARATAPHHIDGKTPDDEVAKVLRRFAAGHIDVLCNCDKITEGFDCPAARCVILGFKHTEPCAATASRSVRALQAQARRQQTRSFSMYQGCYTGAWPA